MNVQCTKDDHYNIAGKVNDNLIGQYDEGVYMMKYNEVKMIKNVNKVR